METKQEKHKIGLLGACYLNNLVGIQTELSNKNSASYIQG